MTTRGRSTRLLLVGVLAFVVVVGAGTLGSTATSTADEHMGSDETPTDTSSNATEETPTTQNESSEEASVTFVEQRSNGTAVTVSRVTLPEGGFVVIHAPDGTVLGHSEYLDAGTHENVTVELDERHEEGNVTLTAMAHRDTNDNQQYDFTGEADSEDGPYTKNGAPVTDDACITVKHDCPPQIIGDVPEPKEPRETPEEPEETPTPTETPTPSPTPGATATPTPGPNVTATPGPNQTATPTPAPNGTATPAPNGTATPAPNGTATPAPNGTATPAPNGTATPAPNGTATPAQTPPQPAQKHAISFVAFCDNNGTASIEQVYTDEEGEPYAFRWSSDTPIQTVVVKYGGQGGGTIENHPGGTSGLVVAGSGQDASESQTESQPCPEGENQLVKYEWNDDSGMFEAELNGGNASSAALGALGLAVGLTAAAGLAVRRRD